MRVSKISGWIGLLSLLLAGCGVDKPQEVTEAYAQLPAVIDYNIHVKPILSDKCFTCHGPDKAKQKAGLALHEPALATAKLESGHKAIIPGSLRKSEAFHRIIAEEAELMMPPPESNLALTAYEKAVLIKWIEDGAEYKRHWSFLPPIKATPPDVDNPSEVKNELDLFIQAKLEQEGISPSPMADKETLIRRIYFDLTGLPPTLEQIDAFLADESPDAFEKVVNQLQQTDEYAERMAMEWLDVARYADSHGFQSDGLRIMWPWRDWVIESFKNNRPYDEFVTWQIAGDLLPNATQEQKLATAFLRNNPASAEGGIIEEEYRLKYVFDKTNTVATAFLGLTMECAQCHDHKYDPLSQKSYYEMSAFFNNTPEMGLVYNDFNTAPLLRLYNDSTRAILEQLSADLKEKEKLLVLSEEEKASIKSYISTLEKIEIDEQDGLGVKVDFERIDEMLIPNRKRPRRVSDQNTSNEVFGDIQIVEGISGNAMRFNMTGDFEFIEVNRHSMVFDVNTPFGASAWIKPEKGGSIQQIAGDAQNKGRFWRGWEFILDTLNRPTLRVVSEYPDNYLSVSLKDAVRLNEWQHVAASYDGTGLAGGVTLYLNGVKQEIVVNHDHLTGSTQTLDFKRRKSPGLGIRIGRSRRDQNGEFGIYFGAIDELRVFGKEITPLHAARLARNEAEEQDIIASKDDRLFHHVKVTQSEPYQKGREAYGLAKLTLADFVESITSVMVMEDRPSPRQMYIYDRGEYDAPREKVYPGTPESVMPFSADYPQNRLGLAEWLFEENHPLTARVAVNRYWQMLFGTGLVKTSNDFGNQGSLPSHPELLDWLAVDFMEHGWDVNRLIRQMVLSAAYQRSSDYREDLNEKDPENLLLARAPSFRLQAEMIRDNALASSGLLNQKVGGASVRPYQPKGLWREKGNFSRYLNNYTLTRGDSLYRRSMYTFIKRTSPPPAMQVFDATSRETCTVKRERTNTPLQALVLMNDPQFIEAARVLAERVQNQTTSTEAHLTLAFRLLTGRKAGAQERKILEELLNDELAAFEAKPEAIASVLSIGDYPRDPSKEALYTAALASSINVLMNHDAFYMRR